MTVKSVHKDPEALTMSITCEFDASIGRVWQMWENPRKLERWWGPPTYPATIVDHDLSPGGEVSYYMTGPEGDRHGGWWRVKAVEAPYHLEFEDGFADGDGNPNPEFPTTITRVGLSEQADGTTRMEIESIFPSLEAMEQMIAMGVEEGITTALDQIDDILRSEATAS